MARFDGLAECRPQAIGIVFRKRTEQFVKGLHNFPRDNFGSKISPSRTRGGRNYHRIPANFLQEKAP
jgi:hypothetical protein